MEKISFVIPCYRGEDTVESVVKEICSVVSALDKQYEIIAIDDCSPDAQLDVLKRLAKDNKNLKIISFAKNFGQHAGMMAGLRASEGDCVVIMDDDGQCPIDHLHDLIRPIDEGYDAVFAEYGKKKQSLFKNMCSGVHSLVTNLLTDKPKEIQMTNFVALSRVAVDELVKYTGPYPILSGLIFRTVKRVTNVPMPERERASGTTTYNVRRLFELWVNTITAFSIKPLRFGTFIGILFAIVGFVMTIMIVIGKILNPEIAIGWTSIISVVLLLGGMILFVLGMIGEYIGRIYMSINSTPQYTVRELINLSKNEF